jgi:hypothetical protein
LNPTPLQDDDLDVIVVFRLVQQADEHVEIPEAERAVLGRPIGRQMGDLTVHL